MATGHHIAARAGIPSLVILALLAGCAPPASIDPMHFYERPTSRAASSVALDQTSVAASVATIASRLKSAGVTVLTADTASGHVRARSTGAAFVDCGTLTQEFGGTRAAVAGDEPNSILFVDGQPGGLVRRAVSVSSEFDVRVAPDAARADIGERHDIMIEYQTADGARRRQSERQVATGTEPATFRNGVECRSSGLIAEIIAG